MNNIVYNMPDQHTPVMLHEAIQYLNIRPNGVYIDGTFGRGGHSRSILDNLNSSGKLLVMDLDLDAIKAAQALQKKDPRVIAVHGNFVKICQVCYQFNINKVDGILLDLGISSPQLDNPARGFSFAKNGPLDMRMDNSKGISARDWLKTVEQQQLIKVLKEYGQEKFAKKIANNIINSRQISPINTTFDLVNLVKKIYPKFCNKNPATKVFQAIRIFLNQELTNLQQVLPKIIDRLNIGGRIVIISFHSLEDSIVKNFINKYSKSAWSDNYALRKLPITNLADDPNIKLINLGKIKPSAQEIQDNQRSRSAIMRVAEKCA